MWPHGVKSEEDMRRFCVLMVGDKADLQNYRHRMPAAKDDSWLYFSRGGCADDTALAPLQACVPGIMDELIAYAQSRNNWGNPQVAFRTGSSDSDHWYE